jgi:hypothetical protein
MNVVLIGRMHGHFSWRQSEDEPSAPDIDVRKMQDVTQKGSVRFRISAVDD